MNIYIPEFNLTDIEDKEYLKSEILKETKQIFESEKSNDNRTFEQIRKVVARSKIVEHWLIENTELEKANLKYHDLKFPNGEFVELKVYIESNIFTDFVQKDLQKYRNCSWNKSTWYILFNFINNKFIHKATIKIK